jgi:hypothetical protein
MFYFSSLQIELVAQTRILEASTLESGVGFIGYSIFRGACKSVGVQASLLDLRVQEYYGRRALNDLVCEQLGKWLPITFPHERHRLLKEGLFQLLAAYLSPAPSPSCRKSKTMRRCIYSSYVAAFLPDGFHGHLDIGLTSRSPYEREIL